VIITNNFLFYIEQEPKQSLNIWKALVIDQNWIVHRIQH